MADVTIAMIQEVRERTGVGMNKCKQALVEANGDIDEAISILRKSGMASAVKKQGRQTNEGMIGTAVTNDCVAVVEINSETDFVVQNALFQQYLRDMADEVASTKPATLEAFLQQRYSKDSELSIDEYRATIVQTIGENIQIRRLKVIPKNAHHSAGVYSHLNGKIVVVVEIEGAADQEALAKDIAMHVAAAAPEYLSAEKVPADVIANEQEIAKSQVQGKPANIVDKIVEGKLKAYYDQACLVNQHYIRDDKLTIAELVGQHAKQAGKPLELVSFIRWVVGQ